MTVDKKDNGVEVSCKTKPRNRNEPISRQLTSAEDSSQVLLPSGMGKSFVDPDVQKEMKEIPNNSPEVAPNQNVSPEIFASTLRQTESSASSQENETMQSSADNDKMKESNRTVTLESTGEQVLEVDQEKLDLNILNQLSKATNYNKLQTEEIFYRNILNKISQESETPHFSAADDEMKESKMTAKLESTGEQELENEQKKLDLIDDKCRKIANYCDELSKSFDNASKKLKKIDFNDVYDFSEWHENTKKDIRTCLEKIYEKLTKTSQCKPDCGTMFTVTKNFTDDLSDSLLLKSFENLFDECPEKGTSKHFKRYLVNCLDRLWYLWFYIRCSFGAFGATARLGFKDVGLLKSGITANLNEASDLLKDEDVTKFVEFRKFDLNLVVEIMNADLMEFGKDEVEIKLDG